MGPDPGILNYIIYERSLKCSVDNTPMILSLTHQCFYLRKPFLLEPARGGIVGAAGRGNLSDERWRGTRLIPNAPTRGHPIPRHCDAAQNPPDGCMSAHSLPIFNHPRSKRRYRTVSSVGKARCPQRLRRSPGKGNAKGERTEKILWKYYM